MKKLLIVLMVLTIQQAQAQAVTCYFIDWWSGTKWTIKLSCSDGRIIDLD